MVVPAVEHGPARMRHVGEQRLVDGKGRRKRVSVVVAEQDPRLLEEQLLPGLQAHGFETAGVGSAAALYRSLMGDRYDLVVLGKELPDEDGLAVARHLRRHSSLGIAMLMERRLSRDHAEVFHAGADVCFIKPIETDVLAASLRSLATRIEASPFRSPREAWSLRADGWQLLAPGGGALALSMPERIVLRRLFGSTRTPVPRAVLLEELLGAIGDFDPAGFERVMHRLRRRVQRRTGLPLPLTVIRGTGYLLVPDGPAWTPSRA